MNYLSQPITGLLTKISQLFSGRVKRQNSMNFKKDFVDDAFELLAESMDDYLKLKTQGRNPDTFLKPKN